MATTLVNTNSWRNYESHKFSYIYFDVTECFSIGVNMSLLQLSGLIYSKHFKINKNILKSLPL